LHLLTQLSLVPFPVTIYDETSSQIYVSSNGFISLWVDTPAFSPDNNDLPDYRIATTAIFPAWDDLYIYQGAPHGIFYATEGEVGSRGVTIEYKLATLVAGHVTFNFLVTQWEDLPGVWTVHYLEMTNSGSTATVGIQSESGMLSLLQSSHGPSAFY
jgi:hypothetical protein